VVVVPQAQRYCAAVHQHPVVFFHIGGHKTGTTYLQNVLWRNRAQLRDDGMLYPGWHKVSHVWANFDLRKTSWDGYSITPQIDGAWGRLVQEIREWGSPAIISQESFSLLKSAQIRRALRDLDFADVHVVFTARDMARQLPAVWQEWVKNQSTITFAEFLAAVRKPTEEACRLMNLQDVPAILERWSKQVPAERVHLITVPPPGSHPRLLWERFAVVLGLEPDRYELGIRDTNMSLGAAEVAVLRRINVELAGALSWPDYNRMVKFGLASAMAKRPGTRIALPDEAFRWAVEWAGHATEKLAGAGYQVVGDFADLIPKAVPTGADPDCVGAEAQASVAITALTLLMANQAASRSDGAGGRCQPGYVARMKRAVRQRAGRAKRRLRQYISIAVRSAKRE
jgi:hypothetical protein